MSKIIPVVFSANEAYARFIPAVLLSIKENSDPCYLYRIYIFYSELSKKMKKMILKSESDFLKIEFVNVSEFVKNSDLYTLAHFSKEMYYRLLIPEVLKQYAKVIYLDCDLIVRHDISELFNEDITGYALGGVYNYCHGETLKYLKNQGFEPLSYINSGVLLFNNRVWQREELVKKCFELIDTCRDFKYPDQDVLNRICANKIKLLDPRWNFMWRPWGKSGDEALDRRIDELSKTFYIHHFISYLKPWKYPYLKDANIWLEYAKRVPCAKTLYKEYYGVKNITDNLVVQEFNTARIDIRNLGKSDNGVIVQGDNINVVRPEWIKSDQGQGCVLQTKEFRCHFTVQAVNDGKLSLTFLGRDVRSDGERLPLWVKYMSIRIDDKEFLSKPLNVWHNQYKQFVLNVKDGQVVHICFIRGYYQYSKEELREIILKIRGQADFVQKNIRKITKIALRLMKKRDYSKLYSVSYKKDQKIIRILGLKISLKQKNTAA